MQNGRWLIVWPPEVAAPGAKLHRQVTARRGDAASGATRAAMTLPSATLLAQSALSGLFVGSLYGLIGLGLGLSLGPAAH